MWWYRVRSGEARRGFPWNLQFCTERPRADRPDPSRYPLGQASTSLEADSAIEMASPGTVLENPATGEQIEFRTTASDSGGRVLAFDYYLRPGGFALGKFDHVHPRQEERFDVRSGELGVRVDGDEWTATSGTRFSVLPGTPHTVWNAGDTPVHAVVEIRPALRIEALFETAFGLACDGKTDRRGIPSPLQLAVLADQFREEIRPAGVPEGVQAALTAVLAPLGRRAGYRARYPRHAGPELARAKQRRE